MTRTVFDNPMVAHIWAAQRQPHGRSSNGNISFSGSTLYSYATPIARLVRSADGSTVALLDRASYSVTTSRHQQYARSAAGHLTPLSVKYVTARGEGCAPSIPWGLEDWKSAEEIAGLCAADWEVYRIHTANMRALLEAFDASVSDMMGRRPSINTEGTLWESDTVECAHGVLAGLLRPAVEYAETFDLPAPRRNLPEIALMVAQSFAHKLALWNEPKAKAKRDKARARTAAGRTEQEAARHEARQEEARLRMLDAVQRLFKWREGASVPGYLLPHDTTLGAALRVTGEELQTSWGASVPLAHAIRVLRAVEACRAKGEGWKRNGHTLHVGHFQIDSIEPNGDFKAGCHFIKWQEVERVAGALGLLGRVEA